LLYFPEVTEADLVRVINYMKNNKSRKLDGSSYFLFIKCDSYMTEPPFEIKNASIKPTIPFSLALKYHKRKPMDKANNCCPITLDPTVCKVLEKVISNQFGKFLDKHNILRNI
jgi:hypothetical protein